jgi:large subunit ribosomal protein L30
VSAKKTERRAGLTVRQVRSGIGFDYRQKATLTALGLGRVGKSRRHPDNPQIRGMIATVPHLVTVEPEDRDA